MIRTPLTHSQPQERRDRAESHHCEAVGSRIYCSALDCPHCSQEGDK